MPVSDEWAAALRADTGTDSTSLLDAEIDDIYDAGAALYTDAASLEAYGRVTVFRRLMAQAASRTSYKQNQSQEQLSDLIKNYKMMVDLWQQKLDDAVADVESAAVGAIKLGRSKRIPSRLKEYPNA